MEWIEILQRIESGGEQQTEFKRGIGDLSGVGKAICAFANSTGGVLILGVDQAGAIVGVREPMDSVQERLTSFLQSGCRCPVSARLGRHESPEGWVHWIEVPRQRGYEPMRFDGRVYIRRGRSSVEPSPTELQDLYNLFGYILTEERAIHAGMTGDVDKSAFHSYLRRLGLEVDEPRQPGHESDLLNRGVVVEVDGVLRPTLYGLLAFGKDPQSYPQTASFWIQCVAYDGLDRAASPLLTSEGKGRLDEQVRRAVGWFQGLARFETYEGLTRTDRGLVPEVALREALVNSVAHRDYAITGSKVLLEVFHDRVEITSPGTLPNHMTPESARAGGHPRSRNELMANFLLVMGLMEQRGRGWPVMRKAMKEFNGTDAELVQDERSRFVRVTLRLTSPEQEGA